MSVFQAKATYGGTSCTWVMKASERNETCWEVIESCTKHNAACLKVLNVSLELSTSLPNLACVKGWLSCRAKHPSELSLQMRTQVILKKPRCPGKQLPSRSPHCLLLLPSETSKKSKGRMRTKIPRRSMNREEHISNESSLIQETSFRVVLHATARNDCILKRGSRKKAGKPAPK